jgi:hypothetical protein
MSAQHCYLRLGGDTLEQAKEHLTIGEAMESYRATMEELYDLGQGITASIHIADARAAVAEYPDYILSRGPRGGVVKEKA